MEGIIALLDVPHSQQVKDLWGELEARFGLRGVLAFPYPHVSFQLSEGYSFATIQDRLCAIAGRFQPMQVYTAGLSLFIKPAPVLYIPVVRSTMLDRMHRLLWQAFPPLQGDGGYYSHNHWMPHITLAVGDLKVEMLPGVIELLSTRDFHWEISLDNLTFAEQTPQGLAVQHSWPLQSV
jgi:2'-5' RNA ligase